MTDVIAAHRHSIYHRKALQQSDVCGCFHCLAIFPPHAIKNWRDFRENDALERQGDTALCPACGIDSVIGSSSGYPVNHAFLIEMQAHWFND